MPLPCVMRIAPFVASIAVIPSTPGTKCPPTSLLAHGDHDCLGPHGVTSSAKPSPGLVGAALLSASSPAQPPLGKLSGRGLGDGREHCYANVVELHCYRYITSPHRRGSARHLFSTKSYLGLVSYRCACLTVVTRETAQVCFILHIAACPPFETPVPLSK